MGKIRLSLLVTLSLILSLSIFLPIYDNEVAALSGSSFNPGRIIDDVVFFRPNSMSANDIQVFLNSKVPVCDTWHAAAGGYNPPFTCLKTYSQNTPTKPADAYCPNTYTGGVKSAALIIKGVADACGINPQVLIVLLQKEQSLVTDTWPWPSQYEHATGYACPDTAACDPAYAGFFYQVYYAARQYQRYAKQSNLFNYRSQQNNYILYNPNVSCGGSNVFIQNQATAGLYNYTPYQPNAAALANLYGTGNSCSAYGNRNFWRLFTDWFGPTLTNDTLTPHPDGSLISMNGAVYLIDGGKRRWVKTPSIFLSYGYKWSDIKKATLGDTNLTEIGPVDVIKPGKLFRTSSSSVYTMEWDSPTWKKRLVTYDAFTNLGYKWSEVMVIPQAELPSQTYAANLDKTKHAHGTFIRATGDPKVYVIEHGTRRHVTRPEVLYSLGVDWAQIKTATSQDNLLPVGAAMPYREGTILYDKINIYITDIPAAGANVKRPIGPWECFSDKMQFSLSKSYVLKSSDLPQGNGSLIWC